MEDGGLGPVNLRIPRYTVLCDDKPRLAVAVAGSEPDLRKGVTKWALSRVCAGLCGFVRVFTGKFIPSGLMRQMGAGQGASR